MPRSRYRIADSRTPLLYTGLVRLSFFFLPVVDANRKHVKDGIISDFESDPLLK